MPKDYNDTLNLPKTDFPMRAGLAKTEPTFLHDWEENSLYDKLMKKMMENPLTSFMMGRLMLMVAYIWVMHLTIF